MVLLFKMIMTLFGVVLMLAGVIIIPLPGPFGVPIIIIGMIITLRASTMGKRVFLRMVSRHPKLLKPVRAMLRPNARIVARLWLIALHIERRWLPRKLWFLYRFRHRVKTLIGRRNHGQSAT